MKKILCLMLVALMVCATLVGCGKKEEFEVQSCGSGFYFNRSDDKTYKIKELDAVSTGNSFYLEEYFCSDTLGDEYVIKKGWFEVGKVRLAKKNDYYNSEKYEFDVMEYNNGIIEITTEMNYVRLYSSKPEESANIQIQIMPNRELPLDLTLENVKIFTDAGIPTLFSYATTDVNVILVGENELHAGAQKYTLEELVERVNDQLFSEQEKRYYDALKELEDGADEIFIDGGSAFQHFFNGVTGLAKGVVGTVLDSANGLINGVEGFTGADGCVSVILPTGISFTGDGTLSIRGGAGARGGAATASLFGRADGGDGGKGGDGISCGSYLDFSDRVTPWGGAGGEGGSPSSGAFGMSSGSKGSYGAQGSGVSVANPRQED